MSRSGTLENELSHTREELEVLRKRMLLDAEHAEQEKNDAKTAAANASRDADKYRAELQEMAEKHDSERRNYKRMLRAQVRENNPLCVKAFLNPAQETKMREQEQHRSVLEEEHSKLNSTLRQQEEQMYGMTQQFAQVSPRCRQALSGVLICASHVQSFQQLELDKNEKELTERLQSLNAKLTAAVAAPSIRDLSAASSPARSRTGSAFGAG